MKRRKKLLSMILCFAMLISPLGSTVSAEQTTEKMEENVTEEVTIVEASTEDISDKENATEEETVLGLETLENVSIEELEQQEKLYQGEKTEELVEDTETEEFVKEQGKKTEEATEEPVEDAETEEKIEECEEESDGAQERKAGGYISLPEEKEVDIVESVEGDGLEIYKTTPLPAEYKTSKLTIIKDQNPYGTCWAFGSTVLAETSILKKDTTLDPAEIDFSELQIAYFTNYSITDPLGGTAGDSNTLSDSSIGFLDVGGNYMFSMQAYANWMGAVNEEKAPYENAEAALSNGLEHSLAYDDNGHMTDAYIVNINEDRENAKRLIMEYGALGISFGVDYSYYDEEYNSYYNPEFGEVNHSVTVVGWNDNFPKENFGTEAPENGAWLVRNSWGDDGDSFDGYFWMSYYEMTLENAAYAFSFVDESSEKYYDNNYQYDGSEYTESFSLDGDSVTAANIFEAKKEHEVLKAVSFLTETVNEEYTIDIYKNLSSKKNPESGMHVQSISGKTSYEGLYTVELGKDVYLEKGERYAVVVTLTKKKGMPSIGAETSIELYGWLNCIASSKRGQSFYKGENDEWLDYGDLENGNFRIKAYTNDVTELVGVTSVKIIAEEKKVGVGGSLRLNATIAPENATNQKIIWSSSNEAVASVNEKSGIVKGKKAGKAKITATTVDGSKVSSVTITVDDKALTGIRISSERETISIGQNCSLSVEYLPNNAVTDQTVTWSSSNKSVAKVNSKGVVKGIGYGQAVIVAKVGNFVKKCNISVLPEAVSCSAIADIKGEQVKITWKEVKNVSGYEINRLKFSGDKFYGTEYVDFVEAGNTSYTDQFVELQQYEYFYYITASCTIDDGEEYENYVSPYTNLEAVKYRITYQLNGGENHKKNPKYIGYDAYTTKQKISLNNPTKKGYTFAGWYSDKKYKKKITSFTASKKSRTFYAKWSENKYTVCFDGNGATSGSMSKQKNLKYSKEYTLTKNAYKRKGYKFVGWNTKADGSGKNYKNQASIKNLTAKNKKTVVLYAQWKKVKK